MEEYIRLFIDQEYPDFIDKYLETKTLSRLKNISQFCGCDYTKLYSPLFFYSRFTHSVVVAHMTWHFTHDKKATIAALLHDVGTPCFAHTIDLVFGDYLEQESSEKNILDFIKEDQELLHYLEEDDISLSSLEDLSCYSILENKSPKLCTDRLDGVLHTCFVWLHTHSLEQIREVYHAIFVLTNEDGALELGFKDLFVCEKFVNMVDTYAKELQGNKDKYVSKYIAELVRISVIQGWISLEDLYRKKEYEIVSIFSTHFPSWKVFSSATEICTSEEKPKFFSISYEIKKRNVLPLVKMNNYVKRIDEISDYAKKIYLDLKNYKDAKYAYIEKIKKVF